MVTFWKCNKNKMGSHELLPLKQWLPTTGRQAYESSCLDFLLVQRTVLVRD